MIISEFIDEKFHSNKSNEHFKNFNSKKFLNYKSLVLPKIKLTKLNLKVSKSKKKLFKSKSGIDNNKALEDRKSSDFSPGVPKNFTNLSNKTSSIRLETNRENIKSKKTSKSIKDFVNDYNLTQKLYKRSIKNSLAKYNKDNIICNLSEEAKRKEKILFIKQEEIDKTSNKAFVPENETRFTRLIQRKSSKIMTSQMMREYETSNIDDKTIGYLSNGLTKEYMFEKFKLINQIYDFNTNFIRGMKKSGHLDHHSHCQVANNKSLAKRYKVLSEVAWTDDNKLTIESNYQELPKRVSPLEFKCLYKVYDKSIKRGAKPIYVNFGLDVKENEIKKFFEN